MVRGSFILRPIIPSETHRMYVLVNENQDPYSDDWQLEEIKGLDDKFAIDGTVLELDEQRYFPLVRLGRI